MDSSQDIGLFANIMDFFQYIEFIFNTLDFSQYIGHFSNIMDFFQYIVFIFQYSGFYFNILGLFSNTMMFFSNILKVNPIHRKKLLKKSPICWKKTQYIENKSNIF